MIKGWLQQDSTNVIFGSSGSYKTFIALHMALSIATGIDWFGHSVLRVPVLYVLAEGVGGVAKRLQAWSSHNNVAIPSTFHLLAAPVQLLQDGEKDELVEMIRERTAAQLPGVVIFDTLSRALGGADQNANDVMQRTIDVADEINSDLGSATTLFVAHTGWEAGDHVRGGSAFTGGVSTAIKVTADRDAGTVRLTTTKQRDDEPAAPLTLRAEKTERSIVLVRDSTVTSAKPLTRALVDRLRVLCEHGRLLPSAWAKKAGVSPSTLSEQISQLADAGYVQNSSGLYSPTHAGYAACGVAVPEDPE